MKAPALCLLLLESSAAASPRTDVDLEAMYTRGGYAASDVQAYALRVAGAYSPLPQLTLSASVAVAGKTTYNEAEYSTRGPGFAGPSVRIRYALPLQPGPVVGAAVGFTPGFGYNRVRPTLTGIESARRPYEYTSLGAAALVLDTTYQLAKWTVRGEVGTYLVTDDDAQWGGIHLAAGGTYRGSRYEVSVVAHALFAPASAREPGYSGANDQFEARAYFGVEAAIARVVASGVAVRAVLWKPFGYDSADAAETSTSVGLGVAIQL